MKKLLLTSFAKVTLPLVMPLLSKPADQLIAAFIPTAGDPYSDKEFVYDDKKKLEEMGFTVKEIDIKTVQGDNLKKELSNVDLILVAGGNTFSLLDQARKSGFDKLVLELVEQGVIYVGSSAGSILCCPTIEGAKRFDSVDDAPGLDDFKGLDLYEKIIIPHAQKERYAERIKLTTDDMIEKGFEVITLTDDEAVLIEGKNSTIVTVETT
jgi:dipeptidase E